MINFIKKKRGCILEQEKIFLKSIQTNLFRKEKSFLHVVIVILRIKNKEIAYGEYLREVVEYYQLFKKYHENLNR